MALRIFDEYGARANPPSGDYPFGSIKDSSGAGIKDGTPLRANWGNDNLGFTDALLAEANITPNGDPDTVNSSQRLDALKKVIEQEVDFTGVTGGGVLDINQGYSILDAGTYTIPSVTTVTDGQVITLSSATNVKPIVNLNATDITNGVQFRLLTDDQVIVFDTSIRVDVNKPVLLVYNDQFVEVIV